jgi:hypothetical protein
MYAQEDQPQLLQLVCEDYKELISSKETNEWKRLSSCESKPALEMGIKRVKRSNSVEVGDFLPSNGKGRILKEPIGLGRTGQASPARDRCSRINLNGGSWLGTWAIRNPIKLQSLAVVTAGISSRFDPAGQWRPLWMHNSPRNHRPIDQF